MRCFSADDDTNDFILEKGDIKLDYDGFALTTISKQIVKTFFGELPFDAESGIPHFETVLRSGDKVEWESSIKNRLNLIPEVLSTDITYNAFENNVLSYNLVINSDFDQIILNNNSKVG
jgi:hypothetical protein